MDYGFSKEQEMLKKAARQFAETRVAPKVLEVDEKGEFPFDLVRQMGQMGLIGLVNSKEYGGSGMGHLARIVVIEEMARVYPSLGFFFQAGNLLMYALENFGNEEQKKRYIPDLCKGAKVSSFAVTEQTGGSDPSAMTSSRTEHFCRWGLFAHPTTSVWRRQGVSSGWLKAPAATCRTARRSCRRSP